MSDPVSSIIINYCRDRNYADGDIGPSVSEAAKQIRQQIGRELLVYAQGETEQLVSANAIREICQMEDE